MMKIFSLTFTFISLLCANAAEIVYDVDSYGDLGGTLPIMYDDTNGIASTSTHWKSIRMQATENATVTHFVIRVSNNLGSVPFGFAVYNSTGTAFGDPIGTLIARGYYASHNFSAAGYYAFPFTSTPATFTVTAGTYYHLVFLLTPGDEGAASAYRCNEEDSADNPAKWGSDCVGAECNADMPPGVGTETWSIYYGQPASASWAQGLLALQDVEQTTAVGVIFSGASIH